MPNIVVQVEKLKGVVVYDIDGIALEEVNPENEKDKGKKATNAWTIFTEAVGGSSEVHRQIYNEYWNSYPGYLDETLRLRRYDDMMRKLVQHWLDARNGKPITKKEVEDISAQMALSVRKEIYDSVTLSLYFGLIPLIVTGSFEDIAKAIAETMRLESVIDQRLYTVQLWYGNSRFVYNDNNEVIGFNYNIREPIVKGQQVSKVLGKIRKVLRSSPDESVHDHKLTVIPIGNGWSDDELFKNYFPNGIYVGEDTRIATNAGKRIEKINQLPLTLLNHIRRLIKDDDNEEKSSQQDKPPSS